MVRSYGKYIGLRVALVLILGISGAISAAVSVSADTPPVEPPIVVADNPSPTNSPYLSWNHQDGVDHYDIYRDGTFADTVMIDYYYDSSGTEGSFNYYVVAEDAAGQPLATSNTVNIVVDLTQPTILSAAFDESALIVGSSTKLRATFDAGDASGISRVVYRLSSGALPRPMTIDSPTTAYVELGANLPIGNYAYDVWVLDTAGNSSSRIRVSISVNAAPPVDSTAPIVTILNPAPGATVSSTLQVQAVIDEPNPQRYYIAIYSLATGQAVKTYAINNPTPSDFTYSWDTTTTANGQYNIIVSAIDKSGNKDANSTKSVRINVQN